MSATIVATAAMDRRGSVASACDRCDADLEVPPELVAVLEQGARVVCLRCAADEVATAAVLPRLGVTPEVAAKLRKRERRLARRLGVQDGSVRAWPPPELLLAAEARSRRN